MTPTKTGARTRAAAERTHDLDSLARLEGAGLRALYARGTAPARLAELEGHPRGRMLAVRALDRGIFGAAVRRLAAGAFFPWGGKSFAGKGQRGAGWNRIHLAGRHQLFPFHTRVEASALDGAACIVLDYDLPDNPWFIRALHDEIREVEPGLFLGPAMWKTTAGPRLVLWFALDTRCQEQPVGGVA